MKARFLAITGNPVVGARANWRMELAHSRDHLSQNDRFAIARKRQRHAVNVRRAPNVTRSDSVSDRVIANQNAPSAFVFVPTVMAYPSRA